MDDATATTIEVEDDWDPVGSWCHSKSGIPNVVLGVGTNKTLSHRGHLPMSLHSRDQRYHKK
eukprot:7700414-Ditylum_brightwellii.AAC.1